MTLAAPFLIKLYATDKWTDAQVALGTAFALWCLPQVFWYGLYTLLGQVLNARGSFGPFMWAPVVNNIVGIAGLLWFIAVAGTGDRPIERVDPRHDRAAVRHGDARRRRAGARPDPVPAPRRRRLHPALGAARLRAADGEPGGGLDVRRRPRAAARLHRDLPRHDRRRAAGRGRQRDAIGTGKAIYDNAFLLFMLPHSLVAVSLVTALFTRMSMSAADDRIDDVRADLSLGLRVTGLATVLSATAFLALGPDITAAALRRQQRPPTPAASRT